MKRMRVGFIVLPVVVCDWSSESWWLQETETLMSFLDKDNSGFVTVDEFMEWLELEVGDGSDPALPEAHDTRLYVLAERCVFTVFVALADRRDCTR